MYPHRLRLVCVLSLLPVSLIAQGPPGGRGRGPGRGDLLDELRTPTIAGAPFTGVQSTTFQQTLTNGDHIVRQAHATVYRDSAGRVRTERTISGRQSTETSVVTIVDPVAGSAFRLDPSTMTATEMKVGRPPAGRGGRGGPGGPGGPHDPPGARGQEQDLGTRTVSGVVASGTRTTQTIPAGTVGNEQPILIVRETWFSNDLKMPVIESVADPRGGDSVVQFSRIVLGEPDASLFQVPSGYTITAGRPGFPERGR